MRLGNNQKREFNKRTKEISKYFCIFSMQNVSGLRNDVPRHHVAQITDTSVENRLSYLSTSNH